MPSVTYMNQSAPFWDFIASLEQQGTQHPYFAQNQNENEHEHPHDEEDGEHRGPPAFAPWGWGQFFGGGRGMPHRSPPMHNEDETAEKNKEQDIGSDGEKNEKADDLGNGEGSSGNSGGDNEGRCHGRERQGRCGGRRGRYGPGGPAGFGGPGGMGGPCGRGRGRGGFGGFGARHGPPHHGPSHHGPPHHGGPWGRARWGPWGRGGFGGGFDPSALAAHFWSQFNENSTNTKHDEKEDHVPDADVFDTETAFVVHVSVPGAKKEDIGVNWDAEKSELSIAGVIHRPGDEEFLKTLAMDERKVGAFERRLRLGTRASPAQIDVDGIAAKLEDGILRVDVPKLDAGYVEVRKVDIE